MTAQRKSKNNSKIINYPTHFIYTPGQLYSMRKRSSSSKNQGIGEHINIASVMSDDETARRTVEVTVEKQNDTCIKAPKIKALER